MTCRFLLACLHEEFDVGVGTYYLATLTTYYKSFYIIFVLFYFILLRVI